MDMGAYVIVINAEKVVVSGNKAADKTYFRHVNGRPGSWRIETFNELQKVRRRRAGARSARAWAAWQGAGALRRPRVAAPSRPA